MAWDGLTALAGINSSRKISLLFLVMPHTLSKPGCFMIFWPKRHFLHCFELMISPLVLWPHLIPLTFIQPPPICSCPRVSATATSWLSFWLKYSSSRYWQDFSLVLGLLMYQKHHPVFYFPDLYSYIGAVPVHLFYVWHIVLKAMKSFP